MKSFLTRFTTIWMLVALSAPALSPPAHAGVTTRVSVASDGAQANTGSGGGNYYGPVSISGDGRFVAFPSPATNLVPGDTNGYGDVFVHDRQTGTTERVSVSSAGVQGVMGSWCPSISGDGRFVAFSSYAINLVPDDTNWTWDVFVHDRQTGTTERVSVASNGMEANGNSTGYGMLLSINADGRFVAFGSWASNLVPDDTNGYNDIFVRDRQTGVTERVSVSSEGTQGDGKSGGFGLSISADGRFVGFYSEAGNLVLDDTMGFEDIFIHDRLTRLTERVSVASNGIQGNGDSGGYGVCISADGRFVAFTSMVSNLVPGDTNGSRDAFVRDRQTGVTERVSVSSDGTQGNGNAYWPSISSDGRFVAFESWAGNLVPSDTNEYSDVFVHDRWGVQDTKALPDGSAAVLSGNTATAGLPGAFYAEDTDRSSGIRVSWSGSVTEGDRYRVDGTLVTDSDGERYIDAWNVRRIDTLPVSPLGMPMQFLGGSDKDYDEITGGGQQGITDDAFGLNNIGLLVCTWGEVTHADADWFYLDDGSALDDGSGYTGVKVLADGLTVPAEGAYVRVIGASSCFKTETGLHRLIRATEITPQ